ncbi:hypothetical protein ACHAXS_004253 [Conticribra weissflogii]
MTDHKNLTHDTTSHSSQRVLRQRLAIDQEYHAKLVYYEGDLNTGADGLSRLPFEKANSKPTVQELYALESNNPDGNEMFPLDLGKIAQNQKSDAELKQKQTNPSHCGKFGETMIEGHFLVTFNRKIWVPAEMRMHLISWYHENLQHADVTRLLNTIKVHFGYPGIRKDLEELVRSCDICQRYKITGKKNYGKIPLTPALQDKEPWEVVHIDCTGPWDIQYENDITGEIQNQKLDLLTISDACLGWVEFLVMKNKTAKHTAHLFDINWLCRYP